MSLRTKYLLATVLSVLMPLLAYLFVDAFLTRSILVQDQAASMRLAADLVHSSLLACRSDCTGNAQRVLDEFAVSHPDLEVLVLNADSRVYGATRKALIGKPWHEEGIARLLRGETSFVWGINDHHGEPVLDVTVPWRDSSGGIAGAIHLARSLSLVHGQVTAIQIRHAVFVVSVALMVGIVLSLITYRLVIKRLGRVDHELHTTDWASTAPEEAARGDEIDHLSSALRSLVSNLATTASRLEETLGEKNRLLKRVEGLNVELEEEVQRTRKELLRAEHLSTIGQLSAGLAHELRNPLFIIRASAEELRRKHPRFDETARDITEEVDRVNRILGRLLDLGRPLSVDRTPVALRPLLEEAIFLVTKAMADDRSIDIKLSAPVDCRLEGDRPFLRQAFANLLTNACEAIEVAGTVNVEIRCGDDGCVEAVVTDDGCGIGDEDLAHIFEPFFTRKPTGTGLGLCATAKIFDLHGAEVSVKSRVGIGTSVLVRLPAATKG